MKFFLTAAPFHGIVAPFCNVRVFFPSPIQGEEVRTASALSLPLSLPWSQDFPVLIKDTPKDFL